MWAVLVVGAAALVVGAVLAVRARSSADGWFAYAPLSDGVWTPRLVTDTEVAAWALAVGGLVLLAGGIGYLMGSRQE